MLADTHVHSQFSSDSQTPAGSQADRAVSLDMPLLCRTDHQDFDFPPQYEHSFTFDTDRYFDDMLRLKSAYSGRIPIRIGVELGLMPHLKERLEDYTESYPFDYVIGSVHIVRDMDPYYSNFYEGRTETEAYREYFQCVYDNLKVHSCFDALGHLDYVVRYGPHKNQNYSYEQYRDLIDPILELLIQKQIALECNTAGLKYGLGTIHPLPTILTRYRQLGGELITLGSDAHKPEHLGYGFAEAAKIIKACGFTEYAVFEKRRPVFYPL